MSAAYVSGMLSLEDAVKVSYHRSRLQATTAGSGGMLAVGLSEAEVLEWIAERADVCVAAVNSPSGVTLAGTHEAIAELSEELTNLGVFARQLRVEVPYHSHLMDPILPELTHALADLAPRNADRPAVLDGDVRPGHRARLGRRVLVCERPSAGAVRRRDNGADRLRRAGVPRGRPAPGAVRQY